MRRNKGIDIFRTIALMAVLVYHFYVLIGGNRYEQYWVVDSIIKAGGEIGVTLFFIISGFGIYTSLAYKEKDGKIEWCNFMKKRIVRMLPQYYFSLFLILLITSQATQISKDGLFSIVTHGLMIHNFFPSTCGSISTVLWTMGVIFQFYIIAIPLYKCMKKNKIVTLIVSILFTVFCKYVIFHIIFNRIEIESSYFFIYGRQLFAALDNFVVGMFLASVIKQQSKIKIKTVVAVLINSIFLLSWILLLAKYRYSDNLCGYAWHSVLAILLMIEMWLICSIDFGERNIFIKGISFVAKYQYGIYLWHFVVAANLLQASPVIQVISQRSFLLLSLVLSAICIVTGVVSTVTVDSVDYTQLFRKKKAIK